jgi:uncharacterized protein (DUF4415 family)
MNNSSKTDWNKVDALTDEDIDTSDIPPLTAEFFRRAKVRLPSAPVPVTIQVDPDVLEWFRKTGDGWENRARAALRIYADAHTAE